MRVILITQDEPFFLGSALDYLLKGFPADAKVVACVLLSPSPFGKRETMLQKLRRTYAIFGVGFVFHYLYRYALSFFDPAARVESVLTRHSVPVIRLKTGINAPSSLKEIGSHRPDLLVSIGANELFRRPLLDLAVHGCLNLHGSLLPKYRGLLPSFWVLKNRERYTGVSVFRVDEGIDSGPILIQKRIEVFEMSQEDLIRHSKNIGMDAVIEAIRMVQNGDQRTIENDDERATYFSFPTSADASEFRKSGARFF